MMRFETNLDALGEIFGAITGIQEGLKDPVYMDGLLKAAHSQATKEFDLAAAATAQTGHMSHMWEYGTPGITGGPPKFPDPTSPAARLWVHKMIGKGGDQIITFTFREAIQRNPRLTTAQTGVPSKYLRKMSRRKYIFRWKARVIETGEEVEITPKNGHLLFVPFYGEEERSERPRGRGYQMYPADRKGPIKVNPGATQAGSFTKFWASWWDARGSQIIDDSVELSVDSDVNAVIDAAALRASKSRPVPAGTGLLAAKTAKSSKETAATLRARATERRADRS